MFTIERDINILESAIGVNPFQLGKAKWADVCEDLRKKYVHLHGITQKLVYCATTWRVPTSSKNNLYL
jgi:hypothetical protein